MMATINQRIDAIVKASKAKKNPAKKSAPRKRATGTRVTLVANNPRKKSRITSDEFEVRYSPDGKSWHRWSVYSYEPMAIEVAKRVAKEHPNYHVAVEKIA